MLDILKALAEDTKQPRFLPWEFDTVLLLGITRIRLSRERIENRLYMFNSKCEKEQKKVAKTPSLSLAWGGGGGRVPSKNMKIN